jgi:hypothetical protein
MGGDVRIHKEVDYAFFEASMMTFIPEHGNHLWNSVSFFI